jgi:hypothetical protein
MLLSQSQTRSRRRCAGVAGADAVAAVEQKARELLAQVDAYRDLSSSLAVDES